jgi:thymidylate kinase
MSVLELADAAATDRVLLFGSPPPAGRDVDLLARPSSEAAIAARLRDAGFLGRGERWARFDDCRTTAVELVPAAAWELPERELEALFADAAPVGDLERVVAPAPHHVLLIAARRFAHGRGTLGERRRARIEDALARDPAAWERAERHAAAWGAGTALRLLRHAYERGETAGRADLVRAVAEQRRAAGRPPAVAWLEASRAAAQRTRRPAVISLSGIDGAGKSFQARRLEAALDRLGIGAAVVWSPFGGGRATDVIGEPLKAVLRRLPFGPLARHRDGPAPRSVMSGPAAPRGRGSAVLHLLWTSFVVVLDAASQRSAALRHAARGQVVIFDRQALDSMVHMRVVYGEQRSLRVQQSLARAVAPRPRVAYLLEIRPETSLARKDDVWELEQLRAHARLYHEHHARLGVRRLDGERPPEELCAQIASEVWTALA